MLGLVSQHGLVLATGPPPPTHPSLLGHPARRPGALPGTAGGPAASLQPNRYCYNWDFLNNTGQDVNDLHIRLAGIQNITDVYTGTLNVFGPPDNTSGYDPGTNVYALNFSGNTVNAGDLTHIGICTDQPVLALDPASATPPFTWTVDGNAVNVQPAFAGLTWSWADRTHLQVQLTNDPQLTMTLMSLNVLDAGNQFGLDDLNGDVAAGLPLVSVLAPDPLDLPPGAANTFDVFFAPAPADLAPMPAGLTRRPSKALVDTAPMLAPNHPYVLEAVLADDNDPGNTIHLYSQSLSPLAQVLLPIALRN